MISDSSNGYTASSNLTSLQGQYPYLAFNNKKTSLVGGGDYFACNFSNPVYLQIQMPSEVEVKRYSIYAGYGGDVNKRTPKDWTFEGSNNGTSWTILDTQTNQYFDVNSEKIYTINNSANYNFYRLNITAKNIDPEGAIEVIIGELSLYK